jgi:PAS domain S-box-containing protein
MESFVNTADPRHQFEAFEQRSQANLLDRILLLFAAAPLLIIAVPVISGREREVNNLDLPAVFLFYLLLVGVVFVNRRYGARTATQLLLTVGAVSTYGAAIPDTPQSLDTFILGMLVAWVILATTFLSLQTAMRIAILHGIGILIFAYTAPFTNPNDILNGPLLLYLVLVSLSLLFTYQRTQLEATRNVFINASELRLRTITETMRDAIFMTDAEGNIVYATPSAEMLFSVEGKPLVGDSLRAWMEGVHPEDRHELESQLVTLKDSHSGIPYQYRFLKPGHPFMWIETNSSLLRNAKRHPTGLIFVSRNITERKKAEGQRMELGIQRERLQLFQRFVSDVSHDLRTPLAVISTSLYLLRKKLKADDNDVVQPQFESIQAQISHLEKQLENLTTLSRLQDKQARYHFEPEPLNAPIEQLEREFAARLAERKITIDLQLTDEPGRIMISQSEFMQALRQIMTNALQYTPAQGVITIKTSLPNNQALIEITDTGHGIDAMDIDHIFEPLYRVDRARSIDSGGMGLGLSVTRTIIEAHSGTIGVISTPGSGSTFAIRIPAMLEPAQFYAPAVANMVVDSKLAD